MTTPVLHKYFDFGKSALANLTLPSGERVLLSIVPSGRFAVRRLEAEAIRDLKPRISWDRVHNTLRPLPGTKQLAVVGGGAIPDTGQFPLHLGEDGPHGSFDAIPTCEAFREAVNEADLDYLVTTPFLNFLDSGAPVPSPEAGWLRGDPAAKPILRSGPMTTVWRIDGMLDTRCGPEQAPLRRVPDTPGA